MGGVRNYPVPSYRWPYTLSFISLSPVSLKARLLFSRCRDTPFLLLFCTPLLPGSLRLSFPFTARSVSDRHLLSFPLKSFLDCICRQFGASCRRAAGSQTWHTTAPRSPVISKNTQRNDSTAITTTRSFPLNTRS